VNDEGKELVEEEFVTCFEKQYLHFYWKDIRIVTRILAWIRTSTSGKVSWDICHVVA
jgi:hypothetical protein